MKNIFIAISCVLAISACKPVPSTAYYNRGDPENLLDVSTEVVTVPLSSRANLQEMATILASDVPVRAELSCTLTDSFCAQAKETFAQYHVPTIMQGHGSVATLYYERVQARDCENRYVENLNDKYALNPPAMGCSVTANTVQMVSDKRQFSNPQLLDFQDGAKATQNYDRYLRPPQEGKKSESLLKQLSNSSGGTGGGR